MAEASRPPVSTTAVIEDDLRMTRPWYRALSNLFRWILNLQQLGQITTADIPDSAVTAAATVTSADGTAAGVGYVQATAATWVTLMNETKADVNTNAAKLDALVAEMNTIGDLVNE